MREDVHQNLDPAVKEKMSKTIVYLGMVSIFMAFAGLSSAYIVSMGDSFWLKYSLPTAFWISTFIIIVASVTIHWSIIAMKQGKSSLSKALVATTTVLSIAFAYSQFKGYKQLIQKGAYMVSSVMVDEGRYGDYFEIRMNGDLIAVDGNDYLKNGTLLNTTEYDALKKFTSYFAHSATSLPTEVSGYGSKFTLLYQTQPLAWVDGKLTLPDGKELQRADLIRLRDFSRNIADGRGDFFINGKMGKDFHLYYQGYELQYKDRMLYYKGKPLSNPLRLKLMSSKDTATSYLYIITFLHLLHVLVMTLYLFFFTKRTFSNEFSSENVIGMRATAAFWHFLGALWIYLLLFLLFIH